MLLGWCGEVLGCVWWSVRLGWAVWTADVDVNVDVNVDVVGCARVCVRVDKVKCLVELFCSAGSVCMYYTDGWRAGSADRQADRQADSQADRQTDHC